MDKKRNIGTAYSEEALYSNEKLKKGPSQASVTSNSSKTPADLNQSLKHVNVKAAIQQRNAEIERATAEAKKIPSKANGLRSRNLEDSCNSSKSKIFDNCIETSRSDVKVNIAQAVPQRLRSLSTSVFLTII